MWFFEELAPAKIAGKRVLEIGCGPTKRSPNTVGMDKNPRTAADVIHDLDAFPYPFPDNEFDIVIAEHVIEHLNDVIRVVEEVHRVLKPGGRLYVAVPYFASHLYFNDPTHRHSFATRSFDYFVAGTELSKYRYSTCFFKKVRVSFSGREDRFLGNLWSKWVNNHQFFYERRLAFILPKDVLFFQLEAVKGEVQA